MEFDDLAKDLKFLVENSIIKFSNMAKTSETIHSLKSADDYLAAVYKRDSFYTYDSYSGEAIGKLGLSDDIYDIESFFEDKENIPEEYRNKILEYEREIIIRDFVESNNYYRVYVGLPPIEQLEPDMITLPFSIVNGFMYHDGGTTTIDIQRIPPMIFKFINNNGFFDNYIKENPDKTYLKFVHTNKLNNVVIREAQNFSLLKVNKGNLSDEMYSSFLKTYNECRDYFTTVIYAPDMNNSYVMYDNLIGMCIMLMTIQRMTANIIEQAIDRNIYSWSFIKSIYNMYNIPIVEALSKENHILIMKNINNLLFNKSTDKVIFDIAHLLGYRKLDIFKYFIVKSHKLDPITNNPKFIYKTHEVNGVTVPLTETINGVEVPVLDNQATYDISMFAVNMKDNDILSALSDPTNEKDFTEITGNDPYWVQDTEVTNVIYNEEYNILETKYIGMRFMYKMTEMLFEISYTFRMFIDKADQSSIDIGTKNISIKLPKISSTKEFSLFNVVVFIFCIFCKKSGFDAYTITSETQVSHVYGFNYKKLDLVIDDIIVNLSDVIDNETLALLNDIKMTGINSKASVDKAYSLIREFNDHIIKQMRKTTDLETYRAYKEIFKILMVTDAQDSMFTYTNPNGDEVKPTSYLEYLQNSDTDLYNYIANTPNDEIFNIMGHIIAQLEDSLKELKYLYFLEDSNNPTFRALLDLISFFKSYTADMSDMNIVYLFDSKYYNLIKPMGYLKRLEVHDIWKDNINTLFSESLNSTEINNLETDNVITNDVIDIKGRLFKYDNMSSSDKFKFLYSMTLIDDMGVSFSDIISGNINNDIISDNLSVSEKINFTYSDGI